MLTDDMFRAAVARAALAPSVHNAQPARWHLNARTLSLLADPAVSLPVGDPDGQDAGLSCGAAAEAMVLALGALGIGADVTDLWDSGAGSPVPAYKLAATLALRPEAESDGLADQLETRFTWRGGFADGPADLFGWSRPDTILVTDRARRDWLAELNDDVSHEIMSRRPFRSELLSWMRLRRGHKRYAIDGLSADALGLSAAEALATPVALGPLWPVLRLFGATRGLVAEAGATRTAPVIAAFHADAVASPVTTGRAYLRLCLEAASLGFAGWPMAALSDHPRSRDEISKRLNLPAGHRLVQVIRFGVPTGTAPARARRSVDELILT